MGSYCVLLVDDYPIISTKNHLDSYILTLFDKNDINVFERKLGDRNGLEWVIPEDEFDEVENAIIFSNRNEIIKDRLNVIGFTNEKVKENFEYNKQLEIEEKESSLDFYGKSKYAHDFDNVKNLLSEEIHILNISKYNDFLDAIKYIVQNKITNKVEICEENVDLNLINYLLDERFGFVNFPYGHDIRNLLRSVLEILPSGAIISYDITEVVGELLEDEDYGIKKEEIYDYYVGIEDTSFEYQLGEKILILTEGSSDINILKRSLNLLYPHLYQYYSFMDFGSSNAQGGSGQLVNNIKTFIGTGIKNRIIAIFDNDTAAYSALRGLSSITLPPNIKILHYPDFEFANDYPTVGPTGLLNMNINKLACSVELYLGKDILQNSNLYFPIQWTGYDVKLERYQGEVVSKLAIQQKFYTKLEICERDKNLISNYDWSGLHIILQSIFTAF